jgi:hypothetical protein
MINPVTMKEYGIIILITIMACPAFSQNALYKQAENLSAAVHEYNNWQHDTFIEGSPYKSQDAEDGKFFQKNKPLVTTKTRLNYYESNFEFTLDDKTFFVDAATIDSVVTGQKTFLFKNVEMNGQVHPRVVEVVEKGEKNSIYKFTQVEIKPEVKAAGYVEPKPASYYWNEPVYLIEIGDKLIILTNFKKLTGLYPEKEATIKEFIKKNKIKKDEPESLKQLLHYLDQLM